MYDIQIVPAALKELKEIPIFYKRLIEQAIDTQLPYTPVQETKNRKCLKSLTAGFEFEEPLWELRVGEWRIFYDVNEEEKVVIIRAIRLKEKGKTTKEIV